MKVWDGSLIATQPGVSELLASGSSILILAVAGVLVFRAFRERYFLWWLCGWTAYLIYRAPAILAIQLPQPRIVDAVSDAAFVMAATFFAASILRYTNSRRLLRPMVAVGAVALLVAVFRALWWPVPALLWLLHILYRILTVTAAVRLALFSRGRSDRGPWIMCLTLLLIHLDENPMAPHVLAGFDLLAEVLLGISMLLIVLDDCKARNRRLAVVNSIATSIAEAQDYASMLACGLRELKALTGAHAAWVRLLDRDKLVIAQQIGLSAEFLQHRGSIEVADSPPERIMNDGVPAIIRSRLTSEKVRQFFLNEHFDHLLVLPLRGKNTIIGLLALGRSSTCSYTADEFLFLSTVANQLGIAVESLRMFEQTISSQRRWVSTFDAIQDPIIVHDSQFRIRKANRALEQRLGRTPAQIVGRNCADVLPHAGANWENCPYCQRGRDGTAEEPDPCFGGYSMVSTSSYVREEGAGIGTIHIVTDTTEQHASEDRYRQLFQQVQEGVFISTPDGRLLDCNDAFVQMLGYDSREQVQAMDIARDLYANPEQRDEYCKRIAETGNVRNFETVLRRKDGSLAWMSENSFATRAQDGNIVRYQGFLLDTSDKRRADDELRRRNRELHALNAIASIATRSFDLDEILNVTLRNLVETFSTDVGAIYLLSDSRVLCRRTAFGPDADLDRAFSETRDGEELLHSLQLAQMGVVTPRCLPRLSEDVARFVTIPGFSSWMWAIMSTGEKVVGAIALASRSGLDFGPLDEELLAAISRQLAISIDKVRLYEETARAYQDLRRTQEQLLQSEKMSAIGQLISGVAHELNNPLTAILGYAQLLENEEISSRALDFVQKLYKQAQRTHRVVQNLLSFARQRTPQKQQIDLRRVLEDTLALRDYDLKLTNITVIRDFEPSLPAVTADAHQIEQVFLNVINNAVDAMLEAAHHGTLRVRISAKDSCVVTEFHDSGSGIADTKRIFDPFYTTKKLGKGTGLGLSICYGIIKEHGGDIVAYNHPKGGATFRVSLPISGAAIPAAVKSTAGVRDFMLQGRILLVDDEEALLEFEREVLSGAGAEVVMVPGGAEAIARLQEESFDAIVMDGKMPGLTGIDVYFWIKENRPGLETKLLLTLSNVTDPETMAFLQETRVPCLAKPFSVSDLLMTIRRMLLQSKQQIAKPPNPAMQHPKTRGGSESFT